MDRGAIRFVLGGAQIMCPGLTSPGGRMEEELPAETPVVRAYGDRFMYGMADTCANSCTPFSPQAIRAEGKELELAIGITKLSTTDMYVLVCSAPCAVHVCDGVGCLPLGG